MNNLTITFPIRIATDIGTGIITAYFTDDPATVTQGTDMDQVRRRLVVARNLVMQARKKYGFRVVVKIKALESGFRNSELIYKKVLGN